MKEEFFMKKGLQLVLVMMLFIQQFMMMPFSVIAQEWSSDEGINIKTIEMINNEGGKVSTIEDNSKVIMEVTFEATQAEESERTLYFPEAVSAHPGAQVLRNDLGDDMGEYILTEKQLTLKTLPKENAEEAEQTQSGTVRFSVNLKASQAGKQTLAFKSEGDEWGLDVTVSQTAEEETENVIEETEDKVDAEENTSAENDAKENTSEENVNTEATDEKTTEEAENSSDKEVEAEAETETIESADAKETETKETETKEINKADKAETAVPFAEVLDQLQFQNVKFTDSEGVEFSSDHPYDLSSTPIGRLSLDWFLVQGHTVTAGDTYTFQLPDAFKPVSGTSGILGDVGNWTVNKAGEVTFTFNEAVDGDEVNGNFWFEVLLDEDALSNEIEQEIPIDIIPDTSVTFPVTPKNSGLLDKKGTINNEGFNSTEAFWTVDINTSLQEMVDPVVSDDLPTRMLFKEGSLVVTQLKMTPQGERIETGTLSPDHYSVSTEGGKLIVDLNGLDEEQLKKAYRLDYTTTIVEPESNFDGSQSFKNKAVLSSDGKTHTARSTVSSGYGKAIEKLSPKYNRVEQSFDWTINYNFNEKLIDAGNAKLVDSWTPKGQMALDEGSLKVYPVEIDQNGKATVGADPIASSLYTVSVNSDDSGFKLTFNDTVDRQAYQLRYTTDVLGEKGNTVVESNGKVTNKVTTGTEHSDGSSGKWGQQGIIKKHIDTDVGNKQIDWQMKLNQNSYLMENLVLTDVFKDDGLTLIEDDSNYSKYALKLLKADGTEFKGYSLDYTAPKETKPGQFVINFTESIDFPLTLNYSTHFERNSDGSASYTNQAKISWTEDGNDYTSDSGDITSGDTGLTAVNGVKNGQYNAVTKEITWSVYANYARLQLEDDFEISDVLPEHQEWLTDSFDVFTYEVGEKGQIINEEPLDESFYTLTFEDGENAAFSLKLKDTMTNQRQAVGIHFSTEFSDGWVRDAKVNNTATVVNNGEEIKLDAGVTIPFGGIFADKKGKQTGEYAEYIDWEVSLNPNQSVISDFKLTDEPDLNSRLLKDTFVLYEANVNRNGKLSKTENKLTEGEDYTLNIMTDQETGKQSFELSFSEEIDQAYILTYRSYIDPLVNKGEAIKNNYKAEGTAKENKLLTEEEVNVFKSNAGGGDGSSVRGSLQIKKVNAEGNDLAGAEFQLYTKNGEQLLRSGVTDQDGRVQFGGLRRGTYLLQEVKAPNRYVISQELAEGKEVTLDHKNDQDVVTFKATNKKTEVVVKKVSTDGPIRSNVVFSLLDENKKIVREAVTAKNGQLIIEDLDPGSYFLKETTAPEGYILNTELVPFTVEVKENGTQQIPEVKVMNYKGSVAFEKTDRDGNALSGVVFEIRNQANETIRTLETNKNGKISATDLVPGEYTVHETKAAEGYILDTTVQEFVIEDEQAGKPDIIQLDTWTNYQGAVRLVKMDEQKNLLEGAVFELRQGDTVITEETTDAEGQITVTGLAPGTYTFAEVASPDGFILNSEPVNFKVAEKAAGEPELIVLDAFINYKGKATISKTDTSGNGLENAGFELRDVDGLLIEGNLVSDENGDINVEGLAPGTYNFVETEAPEGYILNTEGDFSFTIDPIQNGKVETIDAGELINYKGSAELIKTDVNEEPLVGAEFALQNTEGEIVQEKLVSDENGKVSVSALAPGEYTLVETKSAEGYMLNTQTVPFTIVEQANGEPKRLDLGTFTNYQGKVQLEKVDPNGEPLGEATFELTDDTGKLVETLTTNAEGKLLSGPLAPGNYRLEEVKAPEGYIINKEALSFSIVQESSGKPQPNDLGQFINYKGTAEFIKTDKEGTPLKEAHFTLYKGKELVSDKLVSDEDGKVVMNDLSPGQYVLKESDSLDGYILNTETIGFEIDDSSTGKPATIELGEFVNYKGSVRLHKTDKEGQPLEGAEFDLLQDETVISSHTTDEDGEVTVDGLAPGTYTFMETKAPEGFSVNTTPINFEIIGENEGEPTVVILEEFVNYKGQAVFEKTDSEGNPLSGAEFELRDSNGYLIEEALESNDEGLVYANELAPGSYRFVETKAPEGYVLNTEETELFTIDASFDGESPVVEAGTLINYKGSVEWTKTDAEGNPLENAVFKLVNTEGDIITEDLYSDANGQVVVADLAPGQYTLTETKAPNGFILNTETMTFDIEAQAEGQPAVQILNDWVNYQGSLEVLKTDMFDASLEGAVFTLIDTNGQVVHENLVTDAEGHVFVEGLAPGNYTLVETQAPTGYVLDEKPLELSITDEHAGKPEMLSIQVENEKVVEEELSDEEPTSNDTLPQTSVSAFALLTRVVGVALLGVGLYIIRRQKNKK